jgi:hypothetical protein
MKYQTPEVTALTTAIAAIQTTILEKPSNTGLDGPNLREVVQAFEDWE